MSKNTITSRLNRIAGTQARQPKPAARHSHVGKDTNNGALLLFRDPDIRDPATCMRRRVLGRQLY